MTHVRIVHWNESESLERAERLRALGYRASAWSEQMMTMRAFMEDAPNVVVIDLSRLPSHGRAVGVSMRQSRRTRHIPLVFVDGLPEKIETVRRMLPDATYTTWSGMKTALKRTLAAPPVTPHVPDAGHTAYPHSPLTKKLGIKPGSTLALVGAPKEFKSTLGELPEGARLLVRKTKADMVLWFVASRAEFDRTLKSVAALAGAGGLWIAYPKQSAKTNSDLSQQHVRASALAAGLVDWKICAIDETWSGLRFARKKQNK